MLRIRLRFRDGEMVHDKQQRRICLYVGVQREEIVGIYQWGRAHWQPLVHYYFVSDTTATNGHRERLSTSTLQHTSTCSQVPTTLLNQNLGWVCLLFVFVFYLVLVCNICRI